MSSSVILKSDLISIKNSLSYDPKVLSIRRIIEEKVRGVVSEFSKNCFFSHLFKVFTIANKYSLKILNKLGKN